MNCRTLLCSSAVSRCCNSAAGHLGSLYLWGQGVAIDYSRAMALYQVGAEAGDARCQFEVGAMYYFGDGVAVDYAQARARFETAAAQDEPNAVGQLGVMYEVGKGVTPSWRRARELYKRAIESGHSTSAMSMQNLTENIQNVS